MVNAKLALLAPLLLRWLLAGESAPATAGGDTILWFVPGEGGASAGGGGPIDGAALLDAVAVYTRDLRLTVAAAPGVPPPGAADAIARATAALRARGARLGFWCQSGGSEAALKLTVVDRDGHLESRPVEGRGAARPELYRAVALKLRAALVSSLAGAGGDGAATAARTPAQAPGPAAPAPTATPPATPATTVTTPAATTAPAPATAATTALSPATAPAPAARADGLLVVTAPGPRSTVSEAPHARTFFATLGYRLSAPITGSAGVQHAVAAELGRAVHRAIEVGAGVQLATRAEASQAAGSVSVFDLPIAASIRLVGRRGWLVGGAGPFVAAHLLWATATAADGGQRASSFALAGGAGAEAVARAAVAHNLAAELRFFVEAALPGTRYWVRGTPVLERGARLGAGLGLTFPGP